MMWPSSTRLKSYSLSNIFILWILPIEISNLKIYSFATKDILKSQILDSPKLSKIGRLVSVRTYTLCGTPEYLAPEIIQSKGHEKSVDWWALGVLIFEMLAGYPPFYDDKPMGIYQRILDGYYEIPQNIDKRSRDLIKRLLVAEKSSRLACGRVSIDYRLERTK